MTKIFLTFALPAIFILSGCSTPIGTHSAKISDIYQDINRNVLTSGMHSDLSARILNRFSLEQRFKKNADEVIHTLHNIARVDDRSELLLTLSELSFFLGGKTKTQQRATGYYLASAVYAYLFLFREEHSTSPLFFDRRLRLAGDLYNASLSHLLEIYKDRITSLAGTHTLPIGNIELKIRSDFFPYQLSKIESILPADKLSIYGLSVRNRISGLGAPFLALERQATDTKRFTSYPGTVFLKFNGGIHDLTTMGRGTVELYSPYERDQVEVNGKTVPLEMDLSVQLAYILNRSFAWNVGRVQFLRGAVIKSGIYPLQPYRTGRIPVLFVHGTFSTPARWAEMVNTLWSDPTIRNTYQFWYYIYDSGKPIILSANELRSQLSGIKNRLDPEGKDNALNELVVVGHSQGGLLTKLTAVNTGDQLIRSLTGKTLEELVLTDEGNMEIAQKYMIYEALPFVRRVVFISTPHRGSYLAKNWIRDLVQNLISLPVTLVKKTRAIAHAAAGLGVTGITGPDDLATSIDGMSPNNPGLTALADIPLAPDITGHSIIAISSGEEPPKGDDGVVKYTSAHIPYVESEFIVEDGHSCQSNPLVIEEVRRILLKHSDSE